MKSNTNKRSNNRATVADLWGIANAQPGYNSSSEQSSLLRRAAYALYEIEPRTIETATLSHQLAEWANAIDEAVDRESICECGKKWIDCTCDQLAAQHYLRTGDYLRLVGRGWPVEVLEELRSGEIKPKELLLNETRNGYQLGATPVQLHLQGLL